MVKKHGIDFYINKKIGQLIILEKLDSRNGRTIVRCKCLICGREDYTTLLGNITGKEYKSCGCLQYTFKEKNPKWMGYGEISKSFFNRIKDSAKEREILFNLTIEYLWVLFLNQDRKCALSGIELKFPNFLRDHTQTASLDRIDSSAPYINSNVQWIHKDINYMKIDMKQEDFLNYCYKIIEYRNYKPNKIY